MAHPAAIRRLPIAATDLRHYRLACGQQIRPGLLGGHQTRRKGSSLQFRDLVDYQIGDDVRYVDWQASARSGKPLADSSGWQIRRYDAEENLTVAVSIDSRPTMGFPAAESGGASKLEAAVWAGEALAQMVLNGRNPTDRVIVHNLYGPRPGLSILSGSAQPSIIHRKFERLVNSSSTLPEALNVSSLLPYLPPASIWVVFTDLYFQDVNHYLVRQLVSAVQGLRWVVVFDLDSWPYESSRLNQKEGGRLYVPGQAAPIQFDKQSIDEAGANIKKHKAGLVSSLKQGGVRYETWQWLRDVGMSNAQFKTAFFKSKEIMSFFMREAW